MSLNVNINIEEFEGESWKEATCTINNVEIPEIYSYPLSKNDTEIRNEIEIDLLAKGYEL